MDDKKKNKINFNLNDMDNKSLRRNGDMYYRDGIFDLAFKCYELLANKSCDNKTSREYIYATKCLAFMYYYGDGRRKDYEKAKYLYNEAIDNSDNTTHPYDTPESFLLKSIFGTNNYLEAAVEDKRIEVLLEIGDFFYKRDLFEKAYEWYNKAAEEESSIAQLKIGFMFLEGKGVPKNISKSFDWFSKAANNGDPKALFQIAKAYLYGEGREKDYAKSLVWMERASEKGSLKAKEYLPFIRSFSIPIMLAAKDNNINMVKEILNCNVDVNAEYEENITVLMMATFFDSIDVAKELIERGAYIIAKDSRRKTAFDYAVKHNSVNYVKFLIDSGINIEHKALFYAAKYNSSDVAKLAISNGADINIPDILLQAADFGSCDVIKQLFDSGARFGKTVLKNALERASKASNSREYEGNRLMTTELLMNAIERVDRPIRRNLLSERKKKISAILEFYPRNLEEFKYLADCVETVRISLYYEFWDIDIHEISSTAINNFSNYKELIQEIFFCDYGNFKLNKLYKIIIEIPGYKELEEMV